MQDSIWDTIAKWLSEHTVVEQLLAIAAFLFLAKMILLWITL